MRNKVGSRRRVDRRTTRAGDVAEPADTTNGRPELHDRAASYELQRDIATAFGRTGKPPVVWARWSNENSGRAFSSAFRTYLLEPGEAI